MENKWLWSANLMGIAFKFIRMEQTYIFSLGRFDFVIYQRHVLLVPSITYMQTFVGSSSADLCLLVSCLRFIRSPLHTRCQNLCFFSGYENCPFFWIPCLCWWCVASWPSLFYVTLIWWQPSHKGFLTRQLEKSGPSVQLAWSWVNFYHSYVIHALPTQPSAIHA